MLWDRSTHIQMYIPTVWSVTTCPIHWITDIPRYILQISSPRQSDHDKGTAKKLLAAVYIEENQIVSQHPELSRKQISKHAATEVTEADTQAHLHHAQSLLREKDLMQQKNKKDDQWTVATTKLPENILLLA